MASVNRIAVIERCGQCCHAHHSQSEGWVCMMPPNGPWRPLPAGHTSPMPCAPVPDWCPLLRAEEVALVKPLVWKNVNEYCIVTVGIVGHSASVYEVRGAAKAWYWRAGVIGKYEPCKSAEAGKAACEAHYRAALFGENGSLVQIGVLTAQQTEGKP